LRVVAPDGRVVADSQRVPASMDARTPPRTSAPEMRVLRARVVYRAGAWLGPRWRALVRPSDDAVRRRSDPGRAAAASRRPRSIARFAGGYAAATRLSSGGQRSVTLYGAWPVAPAARCRARPCSSRSRPSASCSGLYACASHVPGRRGVAGGALAFTVVGSLTIVRPLRQLLDDAEGAGRSPRPPSCARLRGNGAARRDRASWPRALEEDPATWIPILRFHRALRADRVATSCATRSPRSGRQFMGDAGDWPSGAEDRARFTLASGTDIARLETLIAGVAK
jgi:hypothetical protein